MKQKDTNLPRKENRGGARPGAGRKGEDKALITATVKKAIAGRLKKEINMSATVEVALEKHFAEIDKELKAG